jgi:cell division protein FtsB
MSKGIYILSGVLLFMAMLIVFGEKGLTDYFSRQGRMRAMTKENSIIRQENDVLKKEIERLQIDSRYIESIARSDLGMVKKGDIVYRFIE